MVGSLTATRSWVASDFGTMTGAFDAQAKTDGRPVTDSGLAYAAGGGAGAGGRLGAALTLSGVGVAGGVRQAGSAAPRMSPTAAVTTRIVSLLSSIFSAQTTLP